jgi:hypothetical protein
VAFAFAAGIFVAAGTFAAAAAAEDTAPDAADPAVVGAGNCTASVALAGHCVVGIEVGTGVEAAAPVSVGEEKHILLLRYTAAAAAAAAAALAVLVAVVILADNLDGLAALRIGGGCHRHRIEVGQLQVPEYAYGLAAFAAAWHARTPAAAAAAVAAAVPAAAAPAAAPAVVAEGNA